MYHKNNTIKHLFTDVCKQIRLVCADELAELGRTYSPLF